MQIIQPSVEIMSAVDGQAILRHLEYEYCCDHDYMKGKWEK